MSNKFEIIMIIANYASVKFVEQSIIFQVLARVEVRLLPNNTLIINN